MYKIQTKSLSGKRTIIPITQCNEEQCTQEKYYSYYTYDASLKEHIETFDSVKGYQGAFNADSLIFDVDSEDLNEAQKSAQNLVKGIYENYGLNPSQLKIYFSGSKGFHIALPAWLFGNFEFDKMLPGYHSGMAKMIIAKIEGLKIEDFLGKLEGSKYKNYDFSIYDNGNRIFRVNNSVNAKTGLYKVQITSNELFKSTIKQIKDTAKKPRQVKAKYVREPNTELKTLYNKIRSAENIQAKTNKSIEIDSKDLNFIAADEGERNQTYFMQATNLFHKSILSEKQIRQIILSINASSKNPLRDQEIKSIIDSASSYRDNQNSLVNKLAEQQSSDTFFTFNNYLDEFVEYYSSSEGDLSLCFDFIDKDNRKQYRQKYIGIIGKGGTKKSTYAKNIAYQNLLNDKVVIYANLEEAKVQFTEKFLDIGFDNEEGATGEVLINNLEANKENKEYKKLIKDAVFNESEYAKLVITEATQQDSNYFYNLIRKVKSVYGTCDILIIDGMAGLKMTGNESDTYIKHTAELKQLAKQENICIIALFHVTKECKAYDREMIDQVRGGGKILDNLDLFLGMCNLLHPHSEPSNIQYVNEVGMLNYYGKRASGLKRKIVFDFDEVTKRIHFAKDKTIERYPTYEEILKAKKGSERLDF